MSQLDNQIPAMLAPSIERFSKQFFPKYKAISQYTLEENLVKELLHVVAISDFAAEICLQEPEILQDLIESQDLLIRYKSENYNLQFKSLLAKVSNEAQLMRSLRKLRKREMLRIVWRDLCRYASVEETMAELSLFADHCIVSALRLLHRWQIEKLAGGPLDDDGQFSDLYVIALGKLGGKELNFSSDIDLMFAYPQNGVFKSNEQTFSYEWYFTQLSQRLTKVLSTITQDGPLYRVDLSLRPHGNSGPVVLSFSALENYYQEQGRDWERYALLKARIVAGRRKQQIALYQITRPFVFRRYLDYGALTVVRSLKDIIAKEIEKESLYDDVKRGPGGIRQIEFICQTIQLIRGGQETYLQISNLLTTLSTLGKHHLLPDETVDELTSAYRFLRQVEHILQMFSDRQTHLIPSDERGRLKLAYAMGFTSFSDFFSQFSHHRNQVKKHFNEILSTPRSEESPHINQLEKELKAVWLEQLGVLASRQILENTGFIEVEESLRLMQTFRTSRRYQRLSQISHDRLDRLMPMMLRLIGDTADPSSTLHRVFNLLEAIIRRSAYLVFLLEYPHAVEKLVKLFHASPWMADHLSAYPVLFDGLLETDKLELPISEQDLTEHLNALMVNVPTDDLDQVMDVLRHFKLRQEVRLASLELEKALPLMKVSDCLTNMAVVLLRKILHLVIDKLQQQKNLKHQQKLSESDFAIIAYGKLGGIELSYGSDLDLVFLHGNAAIDPRLMVRVAQKMIHLLSIRSSMGVLYKVDTRLRPSGSAGLMVGHIDSYVDYQKHHAWTWEHQALVRARILTGSNALKQKFNQTRSEILTRKRDPVELRKSILQMRQRMRQSLIMKQPGYFDIKQGIGGIIDLEFIVQYAVLAWSFSKPKLVEYTDNIRILETIADENLLPKTECSTLIAAYKVYRGHIHQKLLQSKPALIEDDMLKQYRSVVVRVWRQIFGST